MTDELLGSPGPADDTGNSRAKTQKKEDASRWIKDTTALVGLIAVLVGSWVSVQGLRDKSLADQRTADLMFEDEKIKLQIAKEQTIQHQQDLELQRKLHDADLQRQQELAVSQDKKERNQRLTDVITRVFTDRDGSAGELSVLFDFLSNDPESQPIIENAVIARLESPRSKEEVDIGLRLLEKIGPASFAFVADVNRSARLRYDDLFFERFAHAVAEDRDKVEKSNGKLTGLPVEDLIASGDSLDPEYDFAMFNRRALSHGVAQWSQSGPSEAYGPALRQDLASAVILRSNLTFRKCLSNSSCRMPGGLDLTETYLQRDVALLLPKGAQISGAYLSRVTEKEFQTVFAGFPHGYWDESKPPDVIEANKNCLPQSWAASGCRFIRAASLGGPSR